MARDDDLTSALRTVVRDHGRSVYRDPRRFRAALSDVLGARSDDLRGQVDALAICVEEDIPPGSARPASTSGPACEPTPWRACPSGD